MDGFLGGTETKEEAINLLNNFFIEMDSSVKRILGDFLQVHTDTLTFGVHPDLNYEQNIISRCERLTKIASIYDLLGLVRPVLIHVKIVFRRYGGKILIGTSYTSESA